MDLHELQDELDELRPHEPENSLEIIMASLGELAKSSVRLQDEVVERIGQEKADEMRSNVIAATVVGCVEYATEHDLDLEQAIEDRLDLMRERTEQHQAIQDALEAGDASALADALDAQTQEVPPGAFETDGDDPRGFQ